MTEPKPQLELIAGADVGGAVTDKPLPNDTAEAARTAAIGVAFAMKAHAGGGKIDPDVALDMLRNAGLIDAEPEKPIYNWARAENRSVILPDQFAIAVYRNRDGAAVIRQHNPDLDDPETNGEDSFVFVQHKNLPEVIAALQAIAKAPCRQTEPDNPASP